LWYAVYGAAHLLLYVAALRTLPAFRRERSIFAYHAISALGVTLAAVVGAVAAGSDADIYWVIAVIALHGIYSTSFLEIWSLAEGGYSLQILELLARADRGGERVDVEALRAIGVAKQSNRLAGLVGIGLVRHEGSHVVLTGFGRAVASLFTLLATLTHVQDGV
jgi:hypothetical protein